MNLLDENIPEHQRQLLRSWRIPVRQIGLDVGHKGLSDDAILVLLHRLPRLQRNVTRRRGATALRGLLGALALDARGRGGTALLTQPEAQVGEQLMRAVVARSGLCLP